MPSLKPVDLNSRPLILLTACINPGGMSFTKLQDKGERKAQYLDAINFYLLKTESNVLFVENSETDISNQFLGHISRDRLEFLCFDGNNYDKKLGKGYGEMMILKYAFEHSKFISQTKSICKITGRYKILNITKLLTHYQRAGCDLMVDLIGRMKYSDSRIFISNKSFFTFHLFKLHDKINDSDGYFFEHALKNAVLQFVMENRDYLPFKYLPRIVGISGTDNMSYNHNFFTWLWKFKKKKDNFNYFITPPDNY